MILAGRTFCTFAPKHSKALDFSSATSSGIMIAEKINQFRGHGIWHYIYLYCSLWMESQNRLDRREIVTAYLARPIVAIDMPVDPTVPSKIVEPS